MSLGGVSRFLQPHCVRCVFSLLVEVKVWSKARLSLGALFMKFAFLRLSLFSSSVHPHAEIQCSFIWLPSSLYLLQANRKLKCITSCEPERFFLEKKYSYHPKLCPSCILIQLHIICIYCTNSSLLRENASIQTQIFWFDGHSCHGLPSRNGVAAHSW